MPSLADADRHQKMKKMPANVTEDQLCEAFADEVRDNDDFRCWVLSKTKFAPTAASCRLMHKEQMEIRPRQRWWRHWWCAVPELDKHRETDIFMIFENNIDKKRFALHIENKKDNYYFNSGQAAAYRPRAQHMLNDTAYLSHSDFQTVLLAPTSFRDRHKEESDFFDIYISYEEVMKYLPIFAIENLIKA